MLPSPRPNDTKPIPVAAPDDTTFTYALRILDWFTQAEIRRDIMTDGERRYRASVIAENFRKLHNRDP